MFAHRFFLLIYPCRYCKEPLGFSSSLRPQTVLIKFSIIATFFILSACSFSQGVANRKATAEQGRINANVREVPPGKGSAKPDIKFLQDSIAEPLSPERTEELLDEVGDNWLYGQGMGDTAVTVGTIAIFPPYALWVVGNAALALSGEEPLEVSKALPEEAGEAWRSAYDGITSVPGRTSAVIAGEDFRTQEVARERIEAVLKKNQEEKKEKRRKEALRLQSQNSLIN